MFGSTNNSEESIKKRVIIVNFIILEIRIDYVFR